MRAALETPAIVDAIYAAFDRLNKICSSIDDRSEIWLNSTGVGMTKDRLMELKHMNVTAIMFSLHSPDADVFNQFMGKDYAWNTLKAGVELCHEAGLAVAFNTCLMKKDFYNGTLERIMGVAKGDLQPCEFLNISFGNITEYQCEDIYQAMRICFAWGGDCILCEKYSKEILQLYREHNLTSLPLTPELSKEIYCAWDRGQKTELYERLESQSINK
mgnify:CR=1 FL=1